MTAPQLLESLEIASPVLPENPSPEDLLSHFRSRPQRCHFDPADPLSNFEATNGQDSTSLEQLMRHEFQFADCPSYRFPGEINWRYDGGYLEWHCWLCRHSFWLALAEGYRSTRDDRYVEEWRSQLLSWHAQVPPHFPARGIVRAIDVGIRLTHWLRIFPVVVHSPAFDGHALAVFLHHIHGMCEYLNAGGAAGYCPDNHGVFEAGGVLQAGYYFPEFAAASGWQREARQCLLDHLSADVRPDGVHIEQSPGYHSGMFECFAVMAEVMATAGEDLPPDARQRIRNMSAFTQAARWPNGCVIPLGDTRDENVPLARAARPRTLPWLDSREPERAGSRHFPDAGYIFLRSSAPEGDQARAAAFDYGPHGGWHGHFDLLSVALYGYGRVLACDPGRGRYDYFHRAAFRSAVSHNAVVVDLHDYHDEGALDPRGASRGHLAHASLEGPLQRLHGWHDGYSTPTENIIVERQVLMVRERFWIVADRVTCGSLHEFATLWHLPPTELRALPGPLSGFATAFPAGNISVISLVPGRTFHAFAGSNGPLPPSAGAGPSLVAESCGRGYFFAAALVPFEGSEPPILEIESTAAAETLESTFTWDCGETDSIHLEFGPRPGDGSAAAVFASGSSGSSGDQNL